MAHKPGRVDLEAIALMITDAVMRELVPVIEQRVREASVATIAPLAHDHAQLAKGLAELGELMSDTRTQLAGTVNAAGLDARLSSIGEVCERFVDRAIGSALERVAPFEHVGTFEDAREYSRNEFVTHKGCMWHARQRVPAGIVPGTDQGKEFWALAVKCGRDAKGA